MNVKKIVLVLIVALMGTMVMNAQPPSRHGMSLEQMVEKRVERLDKQLGLTAEQKAEVTRIYTEEMAGKNKPERMEKGEKLDEAAMQAHRDEMKAKREAVDAKVAALLTPEQATKFAAMKQEQGKRGHGKRHMGPRGGAEKGARHDGGCNNCTCKDK